MTRDLSRNDFTVPAQHLVIKWLSSNLYRVYMFPLIRQNCLLNISKNIRNIGPFSTCFFFDFSNTTNFSKINYGEGVSFFQAYGGQPFSYTHVGVLRYRILTNLKKIPFLRILSESALT